MTDYEKELIRRAKGKPVKEKKENVGFEPIEDAMKWAVGKGKKRKEFIFISPTFSSM